MSLVFCLLSFAVTKTNSGVELIFIYSSLSQSHNKGKPGQELKPGRNLEAGTEAEVMEKCCLLVCSSSLTQIPPFFSNSHISRAISLVMGWTTPHQAVIKKMPPMTCLNINLIEPYSPLMLCLLRCVSLLVLS